MSLGGKHSSGSSVFYHTKTTKMAPAQLWASSCTFFPPYRQWAARNTETLSKWFINTITVGSPPATTTQGHPCHRLDFTQVSSPPPRPTHLPQPSSNALQSPQIRDPELLKQRLLFSELRTISEAHSLAFTSYLKTETYSKATANQHLSLKSEPVNAILLWTILNTS